MTRRSTGLDNYSLEVAVDAFGVDEGELGQSLFPVRHDLSLDEPAGGLAFAGGLAGFLGVRLTP